jgi:SpoVK/Ycf46/Vps4 family AAA+-type ATPase
MECDIDSSFIKLGLGEDEIDGTGSAEKALSTLLNEMDGIGEKKDVIVMACTRDKSILDDAVLRPGKFVPSDLTFHYHCRSTGQACTY